MIWLLTVLLAVNLIFVYSLNGKQFFSPTIIVNGMFLLSSLVVVTNWEFFGKEDISMSCMLIVMLSIYALSLGELLALRVFGNKRKATVNISPADDGNREPMKVGRWFVILACVVGAYVIVSGMISIYNLSLTLGNDKGVLYTFSYVRRYVNSGNKLGINRLITYPAVFVKASALYCMVVFCHNYINNGRSSIKLLLPGVLYCLYTVTSTSRTGVFEMFCAFIIIFYALYVRENKGNRGSNVKLIRITIIIVILVTLLFVLLGNLRTVSYEENTASDIVNYLGSSLIVFSRWLENYELSAYPGYATLPQMINILNKIGIIDVSVSYDEMYAAEDILASSKSNLKTWLRAPIQDFTITGMLFSRFLIGFIYSFIVRWLTNKNSNVANRMGSFIFGCLLFYPLISAPFADKFGGYIQLETLYMAILFPLISRASKRWNDKTEKKIIS